MELIDKVKKLTGKVTLTFQNVATGKFRKYIYHNLVVDAGINSIAARLSGSDVPANKKGTITYCALGTGTTAPAAGDTTLETELVRKEISTRESTTDTATFRTFFTTDEGNGTLKEAGLFGDDASETADSGTLFCHTAIDKTKTSSETLTVDWEVTVA